MIIVVGPLAWALELEQPVEDHQRVAKRAGHDDRVQSGELVAHVVEPGHPAAAGEVPGVRAGVDGADRDPEAHAVDGGDVPVAEDLDERYAPVKA